MRNHDDGVRHDGVVGGVRAIPFQHGEFRQMQIAALAVAEYAREFEDLFLTCGKQFLGREFRRGAQVTRRARAVGADQFGAGSVQMRLVAR